MLPGQFLFARTTYLAWLLAAGLLLCLTLPASAETSAHRLQRKLHKVEKKAGKALDVGSDLPDLTAHADKLLDAARLLEIPLDLWQMQNHLLSTYARLGGDNLQEPLKQAFAHLADRLNIRPNLLGWRP